MTKWIIWLESIFGIATISLAVWLHAHDTLEWGLAIAIALAVEALFHSFLFTFRYGPVFDAIRETFPSEEKPHGIETLHRMKSAMEGFERHSLPLRLLESTPSEWYLQDRYHQILMQLKQDLSDLDKRHFTMPMVDILEPSLRVCRELKHSAFCTALEKHLGIFLDMQKGGKLLEENYKAAARLGKDRAFTRVFILESLGSVTPQIYALMQDNVEHGIHVKVILRDKLHEAFRHLNRMPTDDELDFGLWDDRYRMTILGDGRSRWMTVSATTESLKEARDFKQILEGSACSWQEFLAQLRMPLNAPLNGGWSSSPEKILNLPPPNGPYPQDVDAMWEIVERHFTRGGHLAILGLTRGLIEKARDARNNHKDFSVEIVDCRDYQPPSRDEQFRFRNVNWLEWKPSKPCDVIVGDDVLCNLGIWQMPLFFRAMAEALTPRGVFVVRTTAIYRRDAVHPAKTETINRLQAAKAELKEIFKANPSQRESATYEIAWPMLHSAEFYDPVLCSFDLSAWDRMVHTEFKGDAPFANQLLLPYHVKVTSADSSLLKQWSKDYFEMSQEQLHVHSVWASDPVFANIADAAEIAETFKEYYRILVFTRLPAGN